MIRHMQYSQRGSTDYRYNTERRQAHKHKKRPFLISAACIALVYMVTIGLWPIRMEIAATPLVIETPTQAVSLPWPGSGHAALSATGYGTLGQSGSDDSVPIASITKTITALVVLDKKPLDAGAPGPTITLTQADADLYNHYLAIDGTIAPASAGFRITQYDAMRAMLLPSANNYADTLASWAYDSLGEYVVAANAFLKQHGLDGTTVADASGFSPESKSTSKDLLAIGKMVLDSPVLRDIVSQESAAIPGIGTLRNTNVLLGELGIMGIKTGTTDEAGRCLLFASQHQVGDETVSVIGVVLGATSYPALHAAVRSLLSSAQQAFTETTVVGAGTAVAHYKAPWGSSVDGVASTDLVAAQWPDLALESSVSLQPIAVGETPQRVGNISIEGHVSGPSADVVTSQSLGGPNVFWRLTHPMQVLGF